MYNLADSCPHEREAADGQQQILPGPAWLEATVLTDLVLHVPVLPRKAQLQQMCAPWVFARSGERRVEGRGLFVCCLLNFPATRNVRLKGGFAQTAGRAATLR